MLRREPGQGRAQCLTFGKLVLERGAISAWFANLMRKSSDSQRISRRRSTDRPL
jgi:hypothetical protein